jgi:hypothetical protein
MKTKVLHDPPRLHTTAIEICTNSGFHDTEHLNVVTKTMNQDSAKPSTTTKKRA